MDLRDRAVAEGYQPISDYDALGNLHSIAWCCLPELSRPSVFAAILDHGSPGARARRAYGTRGMKPRRY